LKYVPFSTDICNKLFTHPKIKVHNMNVNTASLDCIVCHCLLCGLVFITDKEGLKKYLKTHDFYA
jgi:hypothetical protein